MKVWSCHRTTSTVKELACAVKYIIGLSIVLKNKASFKSCDFCICCYCFDFRRYPTFCERTRICHVVFSGWPFESSENFFRFIYTFLDEVNDTPRGEADVLNIPYFNLIF